MTETAEAKRKIYWRLKRAATDGSMGWTVGWHAGYPADGLIEIVDSPNGINGAILSLEEIEWKLAR